MLLNFFYISVLAVKKKINYSMKMGHLFTDWNFSKVSRIKCRFLITRYKTVQNSSAFFF